MTNRETVALFGLIAALFPRDEKFVKADKTMILAWQEMLADISFDHCKAAVKASVATSPFPPSISEIREYATRFDHERRLTADEAWGVIVGLMRDYGDRLVLKEGFIPVEEPPARFGEPVKVKPSCTEYEAKRHCPPEVWEMVERMGWKWICTCDTPEVVRGQFMKAWSSHDEEQREKRVMAGVVPELVQKTVTEALSRIGTSVEQIEG